MLIPYQTLHIKYNLTWWIGPITWGYGFKLPWYDRQFGYSIACQFRKPEKLLTGVHMAQFPFVLRGQLLQLAVDAARPQTCSCHGQHANRAISLCVYCNTVLDQVNSNRGCPLLRRVLVGEGWMWWGRARPTGWCAPAARSQ